MNTILLQPTDVLFFRDGRPMEGSLAGHGAAWPLPSVTNAAFHAALHRADLTGVHEHRRGLGGSYGEHAKRDRKFGSLVTAGPFPVSETGSWMFPRPADLQDESLTPALLPVFATNTQLGSLRAPAKYAVGNMLRPTKDSLAKAWLSAEAFQRYLNGGDSKLKTGEAWADSDIFDTESAIGIEIDDETGTTGTGEAAGKIYSAHYLRLRDQWRMGVLGSAWDKVNGNGSQKRNLLDVLFSSDRHIVVGGQQRTCTVSSSADKQPKLPRGLQSGFSEQGGKILMKWVLLSPSVWPEIGAKSKDGRDMTPHPGGWLPNWVHPHSGAVLLRHRSGVKRDYSGSKARRVAETDEEIRASLVAALVAKPIVVTGWALPDAGADSEAERSGGACSTHLAVPAGAVYYFEADSKKDAENLAAALNWHGTDATPTAIKNRRSTLMGEKGFGLGVCGTWDFFENVRGRPGQ